MLLRFYKSYNTLALISVPFIVAGLWLFSFYTEPQEQYQYALPFMGEIFKEINENKILAYFLSILFISIGSFLINSIFNKYEYFDRFVFLPALLYGLGMSSTGSLLYFNPIIISNLFVLLAYQQLLQIDRKEGAKSQVFNFGLLVGISSIFYITNIILFPAVLFVLLSIKGFDFKEILLSFIGLFTPLAYILVYAYLFAGEKFTDYYQHLEFVVHFKTDWNYYEIAFYSGLILVSIIALFMLIPRYAKAGLRYKKIIKVYVHFSFWILIWTVFNFFYLEAIDFTAFLTIPLTFLLSFYLVYLKSESFASLMFNLGLISLGLMIYLG
ncbi:MAG: hypothetical protein KDC84_08480 [Crocinitomicaceae bacterium]|nr:hypothetical protein [Crocinitomicaceae bacterium]